MKGCEAMATAYQNVAKAALINWNGLSEEEANSKIQNETVQELEGQVYAMGSIKYAVVGIAKQVLLNEEETIKFFDAVVNGPENAEVLGLVSEKVKDFSEDQKLDVLSTIHDGWVTDNSSEKTFNKKVDRQQLRQYAPLELIGWNEVRSDLLFLNPVLEAVGVSVNEEVLSQAYHERVSNYMEEKQIDSEESLTSLIQQGSSYYQALPQELEVRLNPLASTVSDQIIQNWNNKDQETAQIFADRAQKKF